jgi:DNA polymerase-1
MRIAMVRLSNKFNNIKDIKTKMLLQIHDELIFEVPKTELKRINDIIKEEMTSVVKSDFHSFSIPLTVDINFGENWGILH